MSVVQTIQKSWLERLTIEHNNWNIQKRESIIKWLLGENSQEWESYSSSDLKAIEKGLEYRYRILTQRYLEQTQSVAYERLIKRLASVTVLRNKIQQWIALSRDRQQMVTDVLEEIIHQLLQSDRYLQGQINWISQCTKLKSLRNSLLLASIEEYCLRPIRNQPLLIYRFVNFLKDSQRGGMTKVPSQQMIRFVSEEINNSESQETINLLDQEAIDIYNQQQQWEQHQILRIQVQQEFETYLANNLDNICLQWFQLYLKGYSQEMISQKLNLPIKQVYRIREKINYHAIKNFTLKQQPELVANWLNISLKEHNFGLTLKQWEIYQEKLNSQQNHLLQELKSGKTLKEIAQKLGVKEKKIIQEWGKLYQIAQSLRNT